ncbi:MAG: hypothetical protein Q8P52_00100 [bacterium]|nr:hypothetical protein [bacterium]
MKISKMVGLVIIVSFVGMSVFGLAVFAGSNGHAIMNCLASLTHGNLCSLNSSSMETVIHQIQTFQVFSTVGAAVVSATVSALYLLFVFVAFSILAVGASLPSVVSKYKKDRKSRGHFSENKIFRWLSLLEHSPTV